MTMPPSTATKSMSADRGLIGKLIGHLYLAAKTLIEGKESSFSEVRHEIRAILHGGASGIVSDTLDEDSADATSLVAWNQMVTRTILDTRKLPTSSTALPDSFKKQLARSIKQGKRLCGGGGLAANEARAQINKASQLYRELSGVSYL